MNTHPARKSLGESGESPAGALWDFPKPVIGTEASNLIGPEFDERQVQMLRPDRIG